MAQKMYWLQATSPLHVGVGSSVGYVDLPIAREKTTNWPLVPGSGIKGMYSEHWGASTAEARRENPRLKAAFGIADGPGVNSAQSGAIVFTDARLVCLPVRSLYGTFAWVTCPLALQMLRRDLTAAGFNPPEVPNSESLEAGHMLVRNGAGVSIDAAVPNRQPPVRKAFLVDLDFVTRQDELAGKWADNLAQWAMALEWRDAFRERFCVVHENVFSYFSQHGTEIVTRVRLEPDTRTVGNGLWTEELLPAETLLSGIVHCEKVYALREEEPQDTPATLLEHFCSGEKNVSVGGKQTVGRGRATIRFSGVPA